MRPPTFIRSRGVAWTLAALVSTSLIVTPVHGVGPAHADDFDDDGDNEGFEAGERFYALGARYTKFKGYSKALTFFKKALP